MKKGAAAASTAVLNPFFSFLNEEVLLLILA